MANRRVIACPVGFGDAVMMYPIMKHLILDREINARVIFPQELWEVYRPLQFPVELPSYIPLPEDEYVQCSYFERKHLPETNQYQDLLMSIGAPADIPLILDYVVQDTLSIKLKKKLCVVKHPAYKVQTTKDFDALIPDVEVFQRIINEYQKEYFFVQVGKSPLDNNTFENIDLDLVDKLTVQELFTLVAKSDMVLTRVGHLLAVAEALERKVFVINSAKALASKHYFMNTVTKEKVVCRPDITEYVVDTDKDVMERFEKYRLAPDPKPTKRTGKGYRALKRSDIAEMVTGKNVVIFGTGPGALENKSEDVEKHDVIIRCNNYKLEKYKENTGSRTDIYYSYFAPIDIKKTKEELREEGVKALWFKYPNADWTKRFKGMEIPGKSADFRWIWKAREQWFDLPTYCPTEEEYYPYFAVVKRFLTTGVQAILEVLSMRPARLYLTGFDFYESGVHNLDKVIVGKMKGHLHKQEKRLIRAIVALDMAGDKVITMDRRLKEVLGV